MLKLLIGLCLMAACVAIHAGGLAAALRWMSGRTFAQQRFWRWTGRFIAVASWTIVLHLTEITVWALVYYLRDAMGDLSSALYFSAVTYTTTGYGDLVLPKEWRLVGGVE
ncbi:MAG TPA: ion channel, partial [Vicinamibacterales bacterium]|nr:ion channel [Vicinamibacterales bacterium]